MSRYLSHRPDCAGETISKRWNGAKGDPLTQCGNCERFGVDPALRPRPQIDQRNPQPIAGSARWRPRAGLDALPMFDLEAAAADTTEYRGRAGVPRARYSPDTEQMEID